MNTVDFVKRCIKYFEYKPKTIQTDNGIEFGYNQAKIKKEHPMDKLLKVLNINNYKIHPRTPEHNRKVERSHRNDNERFYSYLKFYCKFVNDVQQIYIKNMIFSTCIFYITVIPIHFYCFYFCFTSIVTLRNIWIFTHKIIDECIKYWYNL